jgi:hypothetical protein
MNDLQQYVISVDTALDSAFSTGQTPRGNTFEWISLTESVRTAKMTIDSGIHDVEKISAAVHSAWVQTVQKDFLDELGLDIPSSVERKRKRSVVSLLPYDHFPEEEKEKYRLISRTMLKLLGH